jgi:hypothetical protein
MPPILQRGLKKSGERGSEVQEPGAAHELARGKIPEQLALGRFSELQLPYQFPLCGLRDLCAMLSFDIFLARSRGCPPTSVLLALSPVAPPSMGMPRNFRSAFTHQKVEINSLVCLQDVIEKQSVPSTRWRLRRDPFDLSSSELFV